MNLSRLGGVLLPVFLGLFAAGSASAEWTGSGELGLVFARGNTDTETLNTELKLKYTHERWTNASRFSYLKSESDGDLEAERLVFDNKTDYTLSDVSYITGVGRYDRDEFSSFEYQTSLAIGYGRRLIDTERQALSVEIGPGVRYSEIRDTGETETALTVAINDALALKTGFLVRHNTEVEPGREKTDYLSTVNLVYSFPGQ